MVGFYTFSCGTFRIQQDAGCIISIQALSRPPQEPHVPTAMTDAMAEQLGEYFQGRRQVFDVPYQLRGTPFQRLVWNALCQIPYGETRCYGDIAQLIGNPRACRAVGMANHRNPLMIVVPCHRVIGADGSLGGYAGGLSLKEYLLHLEYSHVGRR